MIVYRDDSGAVRYEGDHCQLAIERPAAGVIVVRISGRDVGEFGDAPLRELANEPGKAAASALFIDARYALGASLDVSHDWAQWLGKNRAAFSRISMLTRSRFIQMTADFVRRYAGLGDVMRIYTDPAAFDEALAAEIAAARGR